MRLIMLILITITSLNIITGVVMLVKNKSGDIAILRTIGATRGSMMRVFIMIGGLLGLVGALIGLCLGLSIVLNIGAALKHHFVNKDDVLTRMLPLVKPKGK